MTRELTIEQQLAAALARAEAAEEEVRALRPLRNDPVTGLLVRRLFERDCAEMVSGHPAIQGSLVTVDLDYLSWWNDTHGHDTGNEVLHAMAVTLKTHSSAERTRWYRVGGDEVTGLMLQSEHETEQLLRQAQADYELMRIVHGQELSPNFVFGHCSIAQMHEAYTRLHDTCPSVRCLNERDVITLRKQLLIQIADGRAYTAKMYRRLLLLTQILERDGVQRFDQLARWLLKGAGEITRDTIYALADTTDESERIERIEGTLEQIFAAEMQQLERQLRDSPGVLQLDVMRRRIVLELSRALPKNVIPRLF